MQSPLSVRPLTDAERLQLAADRRTADAFRLRRAQIVLARARGLSPQPMAQLVGCCVQTVRTVIHALNTAGLACVTQQSTRPKSVEPTLNATHGARLQHLLHQAPRTYGTPTGVWTLALAAQVCPEQGVTAWGMREETIRRALPRLRTHGKRATHGITSPDPQYARNNSDVIV